MPPQDSSPSNIPEDTGVETHYDSELPSLGHTSMGYRLTKHMDEHVIRPKFHGERKRHYYPSEASISLIEPDTLIRKVSGGCLRQSYFRVAETFVGQPATAYDEWNFMHGLALERQLITIFKEMGIWVADQVEFYNQEYNVSGKLDCILAEPPNAEFYICEIKTFYGYMATRDIVGNKKQKGKPKTSHLLQILVYLWHFREKIKYGRLLYFSRDANVHKEFKIWLHQEGQAIYPVIDGEIIRNWTVNDIFDRYKLLDKYVEEKVLPPNDYQLEWDSARIELEHKRGNVGDTAYKAWKAGKQKIGDWMCSYCRYKTHCWG
jgi:hypothetical protein